MASSRNVLTPEALAMMDVIARTGSFAAAARELGKVPSALTYNVRQLEEALDALLFDRRSRQARLTAAGEELLNEGRRLLDEMDAVANRVKRVASGWEAQLTVAVDTVMSHTTVFELCQAFFALQAAPAADGNGHRTGVGTRLRLRSEVLAGTWEALSRGQADLAIGVRIGPDYAPPSGVHVRPLGDMEFVFAVAPWHPLAACDGPIGEAEMSRHRAVAVADSAQRLAPVTLNLLPGQDVFTVASTHDKLEAQLRGLGCGYLPQPVAREHIAAGRLVVKATQRAPAPVRLGYAWRASGSAGLALRWWLEQLDSQATRRALLDWHGDAVPQAGA
jgi:DNA-binding transcriptional LysR family regulator